MSADGYTFTVTDDLSRRERAEQAKVSRSVHRLWPLWWNKLASSLTGVGVGLLIGFAWQAADTERERWTIGAATAIVVGGHLLSTRLRTAYARRAAGARSPTTGPEVVLASPEGLRIETPRMTARVPWHAVTSVMRTPHDGLAFVIGGDVWYIPGAALPPHPPAATIAAEIEGWRSAAGDAATPPPAASTG